MERAQPCWLIGVTFVVVAVAAVVVGVTTEVGCWYRVGATWKGEGP